MTDKEIFGEAISKAYKNGYKLPDLERSIIGKFGNELMYSVLFSHSFAKAFWGEDFHYEDENQLFDTRLNWEFHLQGMVLEEEPLKYLEKFL